MSVGRISKVEKILLNGRVENGSVIFDIDEVKTALKVLAEEKEKQDRKAYMSKYYVNNKESIDEKTRKYYREHKEDIQKRQKEYRLRGYGDE